MYFPNLENAIRFLCKCFPHLTTRLEKELPSYIRKLLGSISFIQKISDDCGMWLTPIAGRAIPPVVLEDDSGFNFPPEM